MGAPKFDKKSVGCADDFFFFAGAHIFPVGTFIKDFGIFCHTLFFFSVGVFFCVFFVAPTLPPTIFFFRAHNNNTPTMGALFSYENPGVQVSPRPLVEAASYQKCL